MAGLGELLQRIARDLEQAGGQQPADDLRTRLGYGPGGDGDDEDFGAVDESAPAAAREPAASRQPDMAGEADPVWEPEPARRPAATAREPETAWKPAAAAREPETAWKPAAAAREPEMAWKPAAAAREAAPSRAPRDAYRVPSRAPASPPHLPASPESLLSERIHARLRTPDALREAFVVKELLDRPLGRRRTG